MRCLYEVLDVAKDADESALRKAYRKAALAWHPGEQTCPASADQDMHDTQCPTQLSCDIQTRIKATLK